MTLAVLGDGAAILPPSVPDCRRGDCAQQRDRGEQQQRRDAIVRGGERERQAREHHGRAEHQLDDEHHAEHMPALRTARAPVTRIARQATNPSASAATIAPMRCVK